MTISAADSPDTAAAAPVFRILVVCTANICRSPLVEHILRNRLQGVAAASTRVRFDVSSAGVRGWDGAEMDPPAAAELRSLGGDPSDFRARSFTPALAERADLILTATTEHRRIVLQEVPQALQRTFTVLEFANIVSTVEPVREAWGDPVEVVRRAAVHRGASRLDDYDLADPYGRPASVHHVTAEIGLQAAAQIATSLLP